MALIFKKLGLAITFSPTGKALLKEAKNLSQVFNSELILIHVGDKTSENEKLLNEVIENSGIISENVEIIWTNG
jgi:hypothetical protein